MARRLRAGEKELILVKDALDGDPTTRINVIPYEEIF